MGQTTDPGIQINVRRDLRRAQKHDSPEAPDAHGPAGGFDASDIWSAVDRIRGSRAMSGCHRLVQLLEFVVGSTLQGDASHLKETTIGVAVFGRSPDYDPKVDTIVRSHGLRGDRNDRPGHRNKLRQGELGIAWGCALLRKP